MTIPSALIATVAVLSFGVLAVLVLGALLQVAWWCFRRISPNL